MEFDLEDKKIKISGQNKESISLINNYIKKLKKIKSVSDVRITKTVKGVQGYDFELALNLTGKSNIALKKKSRGLQGV